MKRAFTVSELGGAGCAAQVEKCVRALDGVMDVSINVVSGALRVSYDEKRVSTDDIIAAVASAGYVARLPVKDSADKRVKRVSDAKLLFTCFSALLMLYLTLSDALRLPIFEFLRYPLTVGMIQMMLSVIVMRINKDVFSGGMQALKNRAPNMYTLVSLGAFASAAYSVYELFAGAWRLSAGMEASMHLYFDTSSMILALVALGKYFEARARVRASEAINRISRLRPETARVIRGDETIEIPASEVVAGDTLCVRKGDIVPADGRVLSGAAQLDESMFTGELTPALAAAGDFINGASVCLGGEITMRAEKPLNEMRLTQILSMVESASNTTAPISRTADRAARLFVPLVLLISIATCVLWGIFGGDAAFAVKSAVCVLVVSCPCALGLATPTAIMAGTGAGAESGILIKNAAALEKLNTIDIVMFDKAGTLTAGEMQVTGCALSEGESLRSLLAMAASAMQNSSHPCADAVLKAARQYDLPLDPVSEYEELPGQGISATIGDMRVLVGGLSLMKLSAQNVAKWAERSEALEDSGATALFIASDGKIHGILALSDDLRPSAVEAVKALNDMNVDTLMLTGDDMRAALAIAVKAGVKDVRANLTPDDKDVMLRILKADTKRVMLVSDGLQDAPTLSHAELGVAMGGGTDLAIETADVVILRGDMRLVPKAIRLGRMTLRIIKENLFWAFFYNAIGIPIAAGALYPLIGLQFNPTLCAAAMSLSSICVVVNALRLRRFRPNADNETKKLRRRIIRKEDDTDA